MDIPPLSYLESLTLRLAAGLGRLPDADRARHAGYLKAAQRHDGGFAGREGESDLYYTGFALRGLALLGELAGPVAERAAAFLRSRLREQAPVVDFLSLIYGASLLEISAGLNVFADSQSGWQRHVAQVLEAFRRSDGGYARTTQGHAASTYHSFLVVLCQQLIGASTPRPDRLAQFILGQRRQDGGFVEIAPMRRSGTNPTAAAVGLLRIVEHMEDEVREDAIDFLIDMQLEEGGLRANTRIPVADLLSTFTGMLTLADLGASDRLDLVSADRFVHSLEQPDGGFHGALWDDATDVEYTFYGIGALALLQEAELPEEPRRMTGVE